jgi:hypothetical protein
VKREFTRNFGSAFLQLQRQRSAGGSIQILLIQKANLKQPRSGNHDLQKANIIVSPKKFDWGWDGSLVLWI